MKFGGAVGLISIAVLAFGLVAIKPATAARAEAGYAPVGAKTTPPIGYVQFCRQQPGSCGSATRDARDVVLNKQAMRDLKAVNDRVNEAVIPVTDADLYGRVEVWAFPTGGKGDCEDYVLMKRRMLMDAGWPASALLITVVRDRKGDGHAVLMVKTDRGDFVLDNQESEIRDWRTTGYRYVKRQSQQDPNVWVSLGDTQTTPVVAAR